MELRENDRSLQGRTIIRSGHEISAGDEINARYKGMLVHTGQVTDVVPGHGLFWIMDEITGGRRLLDVAELEIDRVQCQAPRNG